MMMMKLCHRHKSARKKVGAHIVFADISLLVRTATPGPKNECRLHRDLTKSLPSASGRLEDLVVQTAEEKRLTNKQMLVPIFNWKHNLK